MRTNNRSNALLVELLIVILFFMLASTVLIRLFGAAREQSARAEQVAELLGRSQNVADRLIAAEEPEAALAEMGFSEEDGLWVQELASARLEVLVRREEGAAGTMFRQQVTARNREGEELLSLTADRFREVIP